MKLRSTHDYDDLESTDRDCPRCDTDLLLERGVIVDVYRCSECRFEGARSPIAKAVDRIAG